ncbi:30S ribosomal protein S20 [Ignatzschineria indica]|uniref:Small ribosomal subunit protein bS20 n=2 Tax=Ignatzschineria TaxID=112008 RepID=A0A2U2ARZ2_9GAMM|nr:MULTISPECIES: 30S ribosomal protein S20 [Ignatzschineria]MDM1545154.1 30S ribosomal protein S20 [Ignatzschineria indica]OYQ81228.1 30S ribosomal protein S20 [Ignatzschineria sp. F8392]PWD84949.1 30S ribosomal protein S20 [Ignatzschineria indica]PWD86710.1 30S ribosomal protein S20 [Ignatzschineria cameli]PWD86937.1 30S ribosomal protein S20 [Ignatzschineria cameli]
MANTAQARKRVRQAEKHNAANASYRSMTRTYVKKTINAIKANNREEAVKAFGKAQSALDRSVKRGLIHKNKVSRLLSRLNAQIKALAA